MTEVGDVGEYYFDEEAADHVCAFFERFLILPETGTPFRLEPWQRAILREVYGWKRKDGTRKYRTLYLEVPKKNGKSSLASGLALYMLCADGELSGEVYSVAGAAKQARIIFDTAKKMVEANTRLSQIIKPYRNSLVHKKSGSAYHILSSEAKSADGYKASCVLFDELHEQPDRLLWDKLRGSGLARKQPLTVVTTTAGYSRNSIAWEVHDYAIRVRDGKHADDAFYGIVYAADEADDINDPATWRKANPNFGVTFDEQAYRTIYNEHIANPAAINAFKRYYLNLWTQQATACINPTAWAKCGERKTQPDALKGLVCYPGVDISNTTDLTAIALVFPVEDGGYEVRVEHFMPRGNVAEAERRDRVPYIQWAQQGWLTLTEGNAIDHAHIQRRIYELASQYKFADKVIAFDESNAWQLMGHLDANGYETVAVSQHMEGMSDPTKELLRLVAEGKLYHGNNPLLTWQAENLETVERDGLIRPYKGKGANRKRIDGMVATIIGLSRAMRGRMAQAPKRKSVYETQRLLII